MKINMFSKITLLAFCINFKQSFVCILSDIWSGLKNNETESSNHRGTVFLTQFTGNLSLF